MWIHQVPMTQEGNKFVSLLYFRTLLVEFSGVYTCEVSYQSSEHHVLTESFTVDGTYYTIVWILDMARWLLSQLLATLQR